MKLKAKFKNLIEQFQEDIRYRYKDINPAGIYLLKCSNINTRTR